MNIIIHFSSNYKFRNSKYIDIKRWKETDRTMTLSRKFRVERFSENWLASWRRQETEKKKTTTKETDDMINDHYGLKRELIEEYRENWYLEILK